MKNKKKIFGNVGRTYKASTVKMFFFFDDLLGRQYLFEILRTSLTVKISEDMVKSRYFEMLCDGERQCNLK